MTAPAGTRSETSAFSLKVNGAELPPGELGQVVDLTIEQDLILPDAFTIRLRDIADEPGQLHQVSFPILNRQPPRFGVGSSVELGLGHEEQPDRVLRGEITSLELDARGDGSPMLTVRGYDLAYRMHRQRKSKSFRNVSDADIASTIARDYGLSVEADATPAVHEHVMQDNMTDWQFLRQRANRVGYELFVDMVGKKLVFRKPTAKKASVQQFGDNLRHLHLRMSAPAQVDTVVVQGWDPSAKRAIEGRASSPSSRVQVDGDSARKDAAGKLGGGTFVLTNQPVRTKSEADALAQSVLDEIAGDFLQLEGECLGDPGLRPGQTVRFENLGARFDHEYYLSAATHRLSPGQGYVTHFVVSGRQPQTLTALLGGGSGASATDSSRHGNNGRNGVVVGLVTNNKDSDLGGRVKVKFPWLGDDESHWARLASPGAGTARGLYLVPEVGDEVVVAFEHGDVNHPYVLGSLWNGRDNPPKRADDVIDGSGQVTQRILQSRLGHVVTLDDSMDKPSITIVDKTGHNRIELDSTTNKLCIKVDGDISIEAPRGQISIKGMSVSVEATTSMSVKGASAEFNANATLNLKGAMVNVN
jgi:phage protein D/phage baseplate assembly protein gpV